MEEEVMSESLINDEETKNTIYNEYKYIVDIIMHKYYNIALSLGIEIAELEQEAYYAFSDAINSFRNDKNAKLSTFISLCIDRRIKKIMKKYTSDKAKVLNNAYSLDYDYFEEGVTLKDIISDNLDKDPLNNLTNEENYNELLTKIKNILSDSEYEVFKLYINNFDYQSIAAILNKNSKQIDNTIQRLKNKIRDLVKL